MKVLVKTLKGSHFEIDVQPDDKVADVKKTIETAQGQNVYPADQQMLIHQGKILKDDTTLQENKVSDNSFIVIMLSKTKSTSSGASSTTPAPVGQAPSANPVPANPPNPASASPQSSTATAALEPSTAPTPAVTAPAAPVTPSSGSADVYGQAASNLVAGSNLDSTIQHILDMGGGTWDRDMVVRALRAAYNNPERAVEYLYTGIPAQAEAPAGAQSPASGQAVTSPSPGQAATSPSPGQAATSPSPGQAATSPSPVQASQPANPVPLSSGPNTNPLDLFPQNLPNAGSNAGAGAGAGAGILDLVRNSPQFQNLQNMVQANPQILQPMLRELGRQNPQFLNLIQEHQDELLQMMNEPSRGAEGNIFSQLAAAMPQAVTVTPEERESIERLEAMGFDRELVLQVYFACNKDEELAANYLVDHIHEFDDMNEEH